MIRKFAVLIVALVALSLSATALAQPVSELRRVTPGMIAIRSPLDWMEWQCALPEEYAFMAPAPRGYERRTSTDTSLCHGQAVGWSTVAQWQPAEKRASICLAHQEDTACRLSYGPPPQPGPGDAWVAPLTARCGTYWDTDGIRRYSMSGAKPGAKDGTCGY